MRPTSFGFIALSVFGLTFSGCVDKGNGPAAGGGSTHSGGVMNSSGGSGEQTGGASSTGGAVGGGASGGAASSGGAKAEAGGGSGSGGAPGTGGSSNPSPPTFVYVGSGSFGSEPGKIAAYSFNRETQSLDLVSEHAAGGLASFLCIDESKRRLFAVDEVKGGVLSFSVDPTTGRLTSLGATAHTNHPVSLSISPDGSYLLGANYNEGNVDVYPIGATGLAGAPVQTLATGSHAHSVRFDAEGRVLVLNEGADTISHLTWSAGTLAASSPATSPSFSPRHLAFGSDGTVFVVSERGDFITAYSAAASGALTEVWQKPRLDSGQPTTNTGADIHLTPDGKTLYASNRGQSNTIVAYDLRGAEPVLLGHVSSGGTTPRNFAVDRRGGSLIVANHGNQKTLVVFGIGADGKLTRGQVLELDSSPYFVTFAEF